MKAAHASASHTDFNITSVIIIVSYGDIPVMMDEASHSSTRRSFVQASLGGAALAAVTASAAKRPLDPLSPGIKITLQIPNNFDDDDLAFAKQMGVGYVTIPTAGGTDETFARFKQRVEAAGLKVTNIGNANVHNMP